MVSLKKLIAGLLCFLALGVLCPMHLGARPMRVVKNHINNSITAICQDRHGFMWIGTVQGLFRFDGYGYRTFTDQVYQELPVSKTNIRTIFRDEDDNLWIGTDMGAVVYISATDSFVMLEGELQELKLNVFCQSTSGEIVAGTSRGVAVIDPWDYSYRFLNETGNPSSGGMNFMFGATDSRGDIWMAGPECFVRLDFGWEKGARPDVRLWTERHRLGIFTIDAFDRIWYCDGEDTYMSALPDKDGKFERIPVLSSAEAKAISFKGNEVWIGTSYNGLHRFTLDSLGNIARREEVWVNRLRKNDLANYTFTIFTDRSQNVWLGTIDGLFLESGQAFTPAFHTISESENELRHNVVSDICPDRNGNLWVSTADGLEKIFYQGGGNYRVTHYSNTVSNSGAVLDNRLQSIVMDNDENLWIGTKNGFARFDTKTGSFFADPQAALIPEGMNFAKAIAKDRDGNIWIGFLYGGLLVWDQATGTYHKVALKDFDISKANIMSMLFDKSGDLWIATQKSGIIKIEARHIRHDEIQEIKRFTSQSRGKDNSGLRDNRVNTLYCNRENLIYAGTTEGLYCYDTKLDRFEKIGLSHVGKDDYVNGMAQDYSGALWVFTTTGIYKYIPNGSTPTYFEMNNGMFSREDYLTGSCIREDGTIFVGGINGVTYFRPQEILSDTTHYSVHISGFSILNEDVVPDGVHLTGDINSADRILLHHHDNQFSFEFSSLYYPDPSKTKYSYILEGFDQDWTYLKNNRNYISYSNLKAGKYTLKIRTTNPSGMWSEAVKELQINILPPWWATWWSYCLYFILTAAIVSTVFYILRARERFIQNERMNRWKQRFYVNVTHGFKTPLTLMQVPLDSILKSGGELPESEQRLLLTIISRNVKRLSGLIYQLLEFRKLEQHKVSLNLVESDVIGFTKQVCDSMQGLFSTKNIRLGFVTDIAQAKITFDPERIETVLFNLLQNAFNHTPAGGEVTVGCNMSADGNSLEISVKDNGTGIRPEHQQKIFERFWQVREENNLTPEGSGIGLSLCQEIMEQHHGSISVESSPGEGSRFTFLIPMGNEHFRNRKDNIVKIDEQEIKPRLAGRFLEVGNDSGLSATPDDGSRGGKNPVFVISNDTDMTALLCLLLKEYTVMSFSDTSQALTAAEKHMPELIITDTIANNKQKGLDFCRALKSNVKTNHIPIIMLTAEENKEDIDLLYEIGVDSFMEKPFDPGHLVSRARQLMKNRINIREKLKMELIIDTKDIVIESADEKFMNKVMEVIETNLANEDFSLKDFAGSMNVSRSVLHSRIQELSGKSPMELLRNVRLQKAAKLLLTNAYNITQVSYMVGFSDPRYFSTSFKKQFGKTPREYMNS